MKKLRLSIVGLALAAAMMVSPAAASAEEGKVTEQDWDLTRTVIEYTADGIVLTQTELGIPDNHAIAILEVPFTDTTSFEITFRMSMNDYVASGRNANDVWTGIGIMGVPAFINWRNSEEYGYAKDTPGLFTRFFSYDGDLRMETSVYQEGYKTAGDDPSSQTVDTWQLFSCAAGASLEDDVTLRLSYDTVDGNQFYNLYVNGECVTAAGEAAFVEKDVVFPEGKIYLVIAMNTQDKASNSFSETTVRSINGVSYVQDGEDETPQGGDSGGNTQTDGENETPQNGNSSAKKGCKSSLETAMYPAAALLLAAGAALLCIRREKR